MEARRTVVNACRVGDVFGYVTLLLGDPRRDYPS